MEDGCLGTFQALKGSFYQLLTGLAQYLDSNIIWDAVFFDEATQEVVFSLWGTGEAHLNFLKAQLYQQVKIG